MTQSLLHPSDRAIAAYATGETLVEVAAHAAGCERCRARVAVIELDRVRLLARLPPARFVAAVVAQRDELRARRRRRAAVAVVAAVGALAAGWLVIPRAPVGETRLKGTSVNVFRKRGDRVVALDETEHVRAGDGLRVAITVPRPARASVWFVDREGKLDPLPGGDEVALVPGENVLAGAVVVDAPCVDLRLVVRLADLEIERGLTCE